MPENRMKTKYLMIVVSVAGLLSSIAHAQTAAINYSNTANCYIYFDGTGRFTFTPGVNNLVVTSGTASGLFGQLSGTYTVGAITTSGSVSSAPVTGSGTLTIYDGANTFRATVAWVDIQQVGTGGSLNVSGAANLTGVTYAGTNPDLRALASAGSGSNVLSFHFSPGISLSGLTNSSSSCQTSFSGSFSP
jgi:hypothetical protein